MKTALQIIATPLMIVLIFILMAVGHICRAFISLYEWVWE